MEGQREHTDVHSHRLSTPALRSMCLHLFRSSRFLFPVLTILLYRHAPSLRDSSPHGPIQPTVSAEQIWHDVECQLLDPSFCEGDEHTVHEGGK